MKDENLHTVNLFEWTGYDGVKFTKSEEELREVFLNEDKSMRYLHENNYSIDSFDPRDIDLVDGSKELIRFNKFSKMDSYDKDSIKREDIYLNSCLQIGLYTHTLANLNEEYLKKNYDEFSKYLPESDVPYYRGIIQRNAGVYLCDFAVEKRNRDFKDLQKELAGDENNINYEEPAPVSDNDLINKEINDYVYKEAFEKIKKNKVSDFAFVHILLLPTIILSLAIVISLITFLLNVVG